MQAPAPRRPWLDAALIAAVAAATGAFWVYAPGMARAMGEAFGMWR